jgi:hypothetical protein
MMPSPVLDSSTDKPADGAVEKILVLKQLHEVLAGAGPRHDVIPASDFFTAPTLDDLAHDPSQGPPSEERGILPL